eukprot:TRINITY_DN77158_c0_g1_i1.p1 TRINITY_DN77158_c0_g1~~TRINITY_DN77158_c0_g1_i1.p1  ORF type:complete len:175 (+),score=19.38 TRINITY_DN77158_c0_g1_i1:109-633(+)
MQETVPASAHYEVRFVLPEDSPAHQALNAWRTNSDDVSELPKGPAHITLGEFTCSADEEGNKLRLLAEFCKRSCPELLRIEGKARHPRTKRNTIPYFLPVHLTGSGKILYQSLWETGVLDSIKDNLHVSVGRGRPPSEIAEWEGYWNGVSLLKLDGKRSRNYLGSWDFAFQHSS